jgi:hypothetical protein
MLKGASLNQLLAVYLNAKDDGGICPSTFWRPLDASQFLWQLLRIDRID